MKRFLAITLVVLGQAPVFAQTPDLHVNWAKEQAVSKSITTLQVVTNPMLRRGSIIHDGSFAAVKNLGADLVRYAAWYPYPKLAVAELEPPNAKKTSWDFSLIDPMTIDFFNSVKGHPFILNFCTIPQWMFITDKPVAYPANPDSVTWTYSGGNKLRDTTMKELTDYFVRIVNWYHNGGFTDELGKYHKSGYHYPIPYWEVLNEPELEHYPTIEEYTRRYDAIVNAIKKVSPETKFVGMALCVYNNPHAFEYFLNPANHLPGTPLDMISYHFYAGPHAEQTFEQYPYQLFDKTDDFLNCVRYIENIRKRLSPDTKTDLDELGTFVSEDMRKKNAMPEQYWNLSASVFTYLFVELSKIGIDVIGESQLVGYPTQFPDVSMMDWTNGKPNARYWVLKLLKDNFGPGDKFMETNAWASAEDYAAQGIITGKGKRVLLFNKKNKTLTIKVPAELKGGKLYTIDGQSGENEARQTDISDTIELKPFAVAVASVAP